MLVPINRVQHLPILSLQTGVALAEVAEPIIDPRRLEIVAFRVAGKNIGKDPHVLFPEDIREVSDIGMIIDSSDQLMPLDDLVRLQEVIDFRFHLLGVGVEDDKGQKLGNVKEYAIDPEDYRIYQLYLKPTLAKSFTVTSLTIHRRQVLSVTNKVIVVKSPTVTASKDLEQTLRQPLVNPFAAPIPAQPDSKDLV